MASTVRRPAVHALPSFRLATREEKRVHPEIYGFVENVFFGPTFGRTMTFRLNNASSTPDLSNQPVYKFSNKNINSVMKKSKSFWEFEENDYETIKYGVYPKHGYQFHSIIPVFDMDVKDAMNKTHDSRSVMFIKPGEHYGRGVLFEIVWYDKVNTKMQKRVRVTESILQELALKHNYFLSNRLPLPHDSPSLDLAVIADKSQNLIQNLLRASLNTSRSSGVITQLGGASGRRKTQHRRLSSRRRKQQTKRRR